MLKQLETIAETLKAPIPGADPWGEDPKYEDGFSELKEEVAKMGGIGSGAPDWPKVVTLSCDLLTNKAKDLNILVYLTTAWGVLHLLEGMVVGLELIHHFLSEDWENIHPKPADKKVKPRGLTLGWLQTQLMDRLEACSREDRALLERAMAVSEQLKDCIYERFENPPANFKGFRNTLSGWLDALPAQTAEPEIVQAPAAAESPKSVASAAPPARPEPARSAGPTPVAASSAVQVNAPAIGENAGADSLYEALDLIAGQLAQLDPFAESSFVLRRMALWDRATLPNHSESRETFFPAPPDEVRDSMKNMMSRGTWESLLGKAEDLMSTRWYWLDLQYYVAQAAQGLGLQAVQRLVETRAYELDQRLSDLKELKFNDGTPFASPNTKEWLSTIQVGGGGTAAVEDPSKTLLSQLRKLGREGFSEALVEAQKAIHASGSGRGRYQFRLAAARFCVEIEQLYWAESLANQLVSDIESHQLARWEPELAGAAWAILLEIARELKSSDDRYLELERVAMQGLAGMDLSLVGSFPKAKPSY